MDRPTRTNPPALRYSLRNVTNKKFPYNTNLPKTSPKRSLKGLKQLPLPNSPTKCKNPKDQITQHNKSLKSILFTTDEEDNTIIDVFSLSIEMEPSARDDMDMTVDVFSTKKKLPLPTEHLLFEEHPFYGELLLLDGFY